MTKLTISIKCFIAGIIPYILFSILGFFELFNLHGGRGTYFLLLLAIIIPPFCFLGGLISALQLTGKHRSAGLALNGLGLGFLLSLLVNGWLTN